MSAQDFIGKWKFVEAENFEEYLKELGVGLMARKAAVNLKPTLEITNEGDVWHFNANSSLKNKDVSFKLGEEFEGTSSDGRAFKSVVVFENGKFVQTQKKIKDSDKESSIVRSIENGKLIVTFKSGSVVARRIYVRE
ncbi:unnamed protein product [Caenorhabditis angaria]|uniref:Cytosolic fatty-acid binding proteins domain-containing protein n=1 Tax=Caenorhabditis angaria TaxID=860376 RepID=A0A9P1I567_9PELO|nr:unnamed protein product [Caenorhabditis angaria]